MTHRDHSYSVSKTPTSGVVWTNIVILRLCLCGNIILLQSFTSQAYQATIVPLIGRPPPGDLGRTFDAQCMPKLITTCRVNHGNHGVGGWGINGDSMGVSWEYVVYIWMCIYIYIYLYTHVYEHVYISMYRDLCQMMNHSSIVLWGESDFWSNSIINMVG